MLFKPDIDRSTEEWLGKLEKEIDYDFDTANDAEKIFSNIITGQNQKLKNFEKICGQSCWTNIMDRGWSRYEWKTWQVVQRSY